VLRRNDMVTNDIAVPVLIVGGGGAGLAASMLLSQLGVENLLASRYAEISRLPKAHVLNQRSMEIFTDIGVAPDVLARSTPRARPARCWSARRGSSRFAVQRPSAIPQPYSTPFSIRFLLPAKGEVNHAYRKSRRPIDRVP
jgi:2-polyprenyl-6-methoxyphenol hydroxylase-like FAD-dependent oxidoreductase